MRRLRRPHRPVTAALAALGVLAGLGAVVGAAPAAADAGPPGRLHLVVLRPPDHAPAARRGLAAVPGILTQLAVQDRTLASVQAPEPVYRWRHALSGYAVRLTADQARRLQADPAVASVQPDHRLDLAALPGADSAQRLPRSPYASGRGGRGTVIGFVDTGLDPSSPLFAASGDLGRRPVGFGGECSTHPDWPRRACNGKVVAARAFVDGFGAGEVRSRASLSPLDDSGHGTQMASLAAGNARVSVSTDDLRGAWSGVAPQARVAVYKACWSAPDPADDGCSAADVVTAVDRAVADGVDVLNLSLTGSGDPRGPVQQALLGAAEADVVVVGAAGGGRGTAAHPVPWVTTVGASAGPSHPGRLSLAGGADLTGAMFSTTTLRDRRVVNGRLAAARGATAGQAARCLPGSLDAAEVDDALVVCERGGIGRVDKSDAVARADGAGMVLLNHGGGQADLAADLHAVPTVHLAAPEAREVRRWLSRPGRHRATLHGLVGGPRDRRVLGWSRPGDPTGLVPKPDLVAPASGLVGAVPPAVRGRSWDLVRGTSAAAAQVSGLAAVLRSRTGLAAAEVRSLLTGSATAVPGAPVLAAGAGEAVRPARVRPGLVFPVGPDEYRRLLRGELPVRRLNSPAAQLGREHGTVVRRVVNRSGRRRTWTAVTSGFTGHGVTVRPSRLTLAPGGSARFRVVVEGPDDVHPSDDGYVTWSAPGTSDVRFPVALSR